MAGKGGFKAKCARCCGILRAGLTLSIPTFFLWSGLVYLATAVAVFVMRPQVQTFLCDIYTPPANCKTCISESLTCAKTPCYQSAMNATIQTKALAKGDPFYMIMQQSASEWHCLQVFKESKDPVEMATKMMEHLNDATLPALSINCVKYNCEVLMTAVSHPDLVLLPKSNNKTGCPNTLGTKQKHLKNSCVCHDIFKKMLEPTKADPAVTILSQTQTMCRYVFPTTTTTTTTTMTTITTTLAGASVRRLEETSLLESSEPDALVQSEEVSLPVEKKGCDELGGCSAGAGALEDRMQGIWDVEERRLNHFVEENSRRLDHLGAPTGDAGPTNAGLPSYSVGEFSKCTCYQQCSPGTMTRRVGCTSSKCMLPKPQVSADCTCAPCAQCNVMFNTILVMATAAGQGVLSLMVWIGIVYMNTIPEPNLTTLSWGQWFLGLYILRLPFLVRICVLVNIGQACFLVFQTFVPPSMIDFQPDCNAVPALQILVPFFAIVMVFQVLLGVLAKLFNRMYPFMFRPQRDNTPKPIRMVMKLLNSLGP